MAEDRLCLFYSQIQSLNNINLRLKTLIVYGSKILDLQGVEALTTLEELWIVECGIKTAEEVSNCTNLKKLYMFSNSLTDIPNLRGIKGLQTVWLSKNKITSLKNLDFLPVVEELQLAGNLISQIYPRLEGNKKLETLNLSGNPLRNLKDLEKLSVLSNLKHLILHDEMYNASPVALLTNYRSYVVSSFPSLETLDFITINELERSTTHEFFESKLLYYSMLGHSLLDQTQNWIRKSLLDSYEVLKIIRRGLFMYKKYEKRENNLDQNDEYLSKLQYWRAELTRWSARNKNLVNNFRFYNQIKKDQTALELKHVGNLRFLDIKYNSKEFKHLDKILNSMLCPYICKEASLERICLDHVIQVDCNNEYKLNQALFHKRLATLDTKSLFLLCRPYPVKNISDWSLNFIEEYFFGSKELNSLHSVTNCIALADNGLDDTKQIHYKLLLRSECLTKSKFGIIVGIDVISSLQKLNTEINELHKSGHKKFAASTKDCLIHTSTNMDTVIPLFIVEYHYIFQDYYAQLKDVGRNQCMDVEYKTLLSFINILEVKTKLEYLTSIEFPSANISTLDGVPTMENVLVVNLSYNHIQDISKLSAVFPAVTVLNLSYNNITSLSSLQDMTQLKTFDLQWNKIQEFLTLITNLKTLKTNLRHLDVSFNPFTDAIRDNIILYFVCKYLPSLDTFNGNTLQRVFCNNNFVLKDYKQLPLCRANDQALSLEWKSELCHGQDGNHIAEDVNKSIVCVSIKLKNINQFRSVLPLDRVKWLDLSDNLLSTIVFLNKMPLLEEINLSNNVLERFDCSDIRLKRLVKLDLSSNYLTSLIEFRSSNFSRLKILDVSSNILSSLLGTANLTNLLEFYCGYNNISNMDAVIPTKQWKRIKVIDLNNNPINNHPLFRKFCIFNLKTVEFINGQEIIQGEIDNAQHLFGGWLDQDYLIKKYTKTELDNITQLTLSNCCINKVLLQRPLPKVQSINLEYNKITSLNWLCWFPKAITVCLSYNCVSTYCDPPTENNQTNISLRTLYLNNNNIKTLSPLQLRLFTNLQSLFLQENEIVSIKGLYTLNHLNNLILDHNKISKINEEDISGLVSLKQLYLEDNCLKDLTFLKFVPRLHSLFLSHNRITDKKQFECLKILKDLKEICMHGNPLFRNEQLYRELLLAVPNVTLMEGYTLEASKE